VCMLIVTRSRSLPERPIQKPLAPDRVNVGTSLPLTSPRRDHGDEVSTPRKKRRQE